MAGWYINGAQCSKIRKNGEKLLIYVFFSDFKKLFIIYVPISHVQTLLDPILLVLNLVKTLLLSQNGTIFPIFSSLMQKFCSKRSGNKVNLG